MPTLTLPGSCCRVVGAVEGSAGQLKKWAWRSTRRRVVSASAADCEPRASNTAVKAMKGNAAIRNCRARLIPIRLHPFPSCLPLGSCHERLLGPLWHLQGHLAEAALDQLL